MTAKGTRVSVYNTLLRELYEKYTKMYQSGHILKEDYNFVMGIEIAKFNKDIESLRTRFDEEDVVSKNPEIFPAEDTFWEYFPKLYTFAFKNKKDQQKFVRKMDGLVSDMSSAKEAAAEMLGSGAFANLPGGMSSVKKLMNNPKFMNLAQKMAEEIKNDPELLSSLSNK